VGSGERLADLGEPQQGSGEYFASFDQLWCSVKALRWQGTEAGPQGDEILNVAVDWPSWPFGTPKRIPPGKSARRQLGVESQY
jgi:hypothetical protein